MQIQKTGLATQLPNTFKVTKKETGPQEQVVLGSSEPTPEFLKPISNQTSSAIGALGGAAIGGVGGALLGGGIASIQGAVDAGIGWGASAIFGPVGGTVATVGLGALGFLGGLKEGSVFNALLNGATNAGATWMGVTHGGTGILYGAAITGLPSALVLGIGGAVVGGLAGGSIAK
ncbi:MAG: hypothetical protein ABRQ39_24555 [Candidatus Eremiobacterota bacterium]